MSNILKTQRWLRVRKRQLAREPLCIECGQPATDVDHVVSRARGGDAYAPSNLQSMCASCHSRKTAGWDMLGKDWTARGCDADGYPRDPAHPNHPNTRSTTEGAIIHADEKPRDRAVGSGAHLLRQNREKN